MEVNGYEIEPGADLTGANLKEVNLSGVDFSGADLTGADLEGANLTGVNFEASLSEAFADSQTTWPEGFGPLFARVEFD